MFIARYRYGLKQIAALRFRFGAMFAHARCLLCAGAMLALTSTITPTLAQKAYGPGVSDTEIKIGTTTPFSGPASAYSAGAVSATAYFQMINEQGGVNGRKIKCVALDDAYNPPKTVEQTRKLIESEEVLFIVNPVGTAPNLAVLKYVNQKGCPIFSLGRAQRSSMIPSIIRGL
jgi:branched-chain amino acid transport system substrate-binding protein